MTPKPGSLAARLLFVACAEPLSRRALTTRLDERGSLYAERTVKDGIARLLDSGLLAHRGMGRSEYGRTVCLYALTAEGEDALEKLWGLTPRQVAA